MDDEVSEVDETTAGQQNTKTDSKTFGTKTQKSWAKDFFTFGNKDDYIPMEETSKIITKDFKIFAHVI